MSLHFNVDRFVGRRIHALLERSPVKVGLQFAGLFCFSTDLNFRHLSCNAGAKKAQNKHQENGRDRYQGCPKVLYL